MPYNPDAISTHNYGKPVERFVQFVCKFCKVPVMGRIDHSARLGHEHKRSCPRYRRGK